MEESRRQDGAFSVSAHGDKSLGAQTRTKQASQELSRPRRAALTIPRADTMRQLGSDCVKSCKQETCRRTRRFVIGPPKAFECSRTMRPEALKIHTVTCRHVDTYSNFHVLLCQVCACMCVSVACGPARPGLVWSGLVLSGV